jgi:hypothetical protein
MKSFSAKLSFLSLFFNVSVKNAHSNENPIIAEKLFDSWVNSQVFIHEKTFGLMNMPKLDSMEQLPLCFGNLLTSKHVLTTVVCFANVKKIAKGFDIKKKQMCLKNEKWITKKFWEIKARANKMFNRFSKYKDIDPEKFIVAKVS